MKPIVQIRNLSKIYPGNGLGSSAVVLTNLSLEVRQGSTLALVGPSGSGKSTLLNLISGLDAPTSGDVLVDGQKVHDLSPEQAASFRNQTIGFIFQSHHLLPALTALENVMVPALAGHVKISASESREHANELLKEVGLADRMNHLPSQLSGGERQRVAVARALINQPKLLLADEPTGALDRANAESLMELICRLNQDHQSSMLLVTHSTTQAEKMNAVWSMEDGKLHSKRT